MGCQTGKWHSWTFNILMGQGDCTVMSLSKNAPLWRLVTTMSSGERITLDVDPVKANTASEARSEIKKRLGAAELGLRRLPVGYSVERMPT